jgi:hypothetical protein
MSRTAPLLAVTLVALAIGVSVTTAPAATYRGRNVDGRRYQGSILNNDYGMIDGVEVKFEAEHAYIYLRGGRLVLILQDESITDPHRIAADDPERGTVWEIRLTDLGVH